MQSKSSDIGFLLIKALVFFALAGTLLFAQLPAHDNRDWPVYGGAAEGEHYSPLAQINKANVKQLKVAWTYDTEETGGLQTSPIVVHGILYGISPSQKIFAVDAATGKSALRRVVRKKTGASSSGS
jgi:glucose dehydrogenase